MKDKPRHTSRHLAAFACLAAACALCALTFVAARAASAQGPPPQRFNGLVAFGTNRDGVQGEVYVMNPDGTGQRNLTRSPHSEVCPSFSPDGRRIAFVRDWQGIYAMDPGGGGEAPVFPNDRGEFSTVMCADWSPDGSRLLFTAARNDGRDNQDIYVVNADGTGLTRLTDDPANDSAPRWSPDGRRIAFSSIRDAVPGEVNFEIYVMGADGSNQTRLTRNTKFDHSPAWSPDGRSLVFTSRRDGNFEVYSMDSAGGGETRLTDDPNDDMGAEWSPDGTKIIFTSSRGNRFGEIYTMSPDGTGLVNLTNADSFDTDPSWQPLPEPFVAPSPTPTPTPTPTPAPTPGGGSGAETEPYVPTAAQATLEVLGCGGRTFVKLTFVFQSGGYGVVEQGQAVRSGNDFSADAKVERSTGPVTLAPVYFERVYDLGTLAPGAYTFTLSSRGTPVKSVAFAAGSTARHPADDPAIFVRQHYLDFLGRDPDDGGFRFWTFGLYVGCGSDAACLERVRVNTSAAFFVSIEFQRTGFLVHRLYRATHGRLPRRDEFLAEARRVARGVVVNREGWERLLEENTRAFLDEWAARPTFAQELGGLGDAQYVGRLYENAGVAPRAGAAEALAAALAEGRMTRAQVLRAVAEDAAFVRKEFNAAFVLMQYFGYLGRNPDGGPDADLSGYNFWLDKLNEFDGDYVRAEMVKAFLNSDEYRARFCGR